MPCRENTTDISDLDLFPACAVTRAMARAAVEQPSKATERDSPEKVVNPAPDSNAQAIEVPSSAKESSSCVQMHLQRERRLTLCCGKLL